MRETRSWHEISRTHHPGGATSLAFSPAGDHLFSGGYDGTVRNWDLANRSPVKVYTASKAAVWTIDVSPDGRRLAAAGEDAVIRIWTIGGSSAPTQLRGHTRNVWAVRFSPDGTKIASGSYDNSARLWDVAGSRALRVLRGHSEAIVDLSFNRDGTLLVTGGDDSSIRFWRTVDGKQTRRIDAVRPVDAVAFSTDGQWLASGGHARGAIGTFWHQVSGGGGEGTPIHLWRMRDAALVQTLQQPDDVISVAFSSDGQWLVTSGEDGSFRLWRLHPRFGWKADSSWQSAPDHAALLRRRQSSIDLGLARHTGR